jgi:diguanylate cyclase (GGDEF)-like protein
MVRSQAATAPLSSLAALGETFGFAAEDLEPSARIAMQALMAALREAEARADSDVLAPVLNRRAFLREVTRVVSHVERYGRPAAVVYLDMDGFKALNDQFGHSVGDAALRHVAGLLRANVRDSDHVGRLGGDEFGVILVETGAEEAFAKAAALEALISAQPLIYEGQTHRLSASVGVHPVASLETAEAALARADEAMYAAKAIHRAERDAA